MSVTALPTATIEAFDRNRLLVDLDDATAPDSPPAVLLVIGLRQLGEVIAAHDSDKVLAELRDAFADLVGDAGSDYRTRGAELCAILERPAEVDRIVAAIEQCLSAYAEPPLRVACGVVELPAEAGEALDALALADRRVTAAHGPVRYD